MKRLILAGAAAAALLAVPAIAVQQPPAQRETQPVTRASIPIQVQAQFARVDSNRDGFVTQDEAQAGAGQMRGQRRAQLFARLDTNRDGAISQAEFDVRAPQRADRAERRAKRAERRAERQALRGQRGLRLGQRAFARIDLDKDGRISLAEVTQQRLARFDRLDTNRDGILSPEERRARKAQRQSRRNG